MKKHQINKILNGRNKGFKELEEEILKLEKNRIQDVIVAIL